MSTRCHGGQIEAPWVEYAGEHGSPQAEASNVAHMCPFTTKRYLPGCAVLKGYLITFIWYAFLLNNVSYLLVTATQQKRRGKSLTYDGQPLPRIDVTQRYILPRSPRHDLGGLGGHGSSSQAYVVGGPPSSVSNVKCGEIVLGIPIQRNEDGTVDIDIGAESPLTVTKESLLFLQEDERQIFDGILAAQGQTENVCKKPIADLVDDTLIVARQLPGRKRKTYMRPRLKYPNDFRKDNSSSQILSYDLGVGGEIKPKQLSLPRVTGHKQPHCWFRDDQMEFIVTDVDTYSGRMKGEIWSAGIVERKRRAYTAVAIEAIKPTCSITSYTAVIQDRDGDLLFLKLLDEHLEPFNAFAMALPKDNPGDRVMVYLAGADPGVQHVYFTRSSISNERLREENLKLLYDEIVYHYVKTGKWFRAVFEEDHRDSLQVRMVGKPAIDSKYTAQIFLSQLPYFNPEGLLNETFKRLHSPNEYFCYHDLMINVGKLNYGFHYDSGIYVRVHEYKVKTASPADRSGRSSRAVDLLELTTLNICNPKGSLEDVFQRLTNQSIESMNDLKIYSTYPSLILGQDDGYLYLAINYKRKEQFTLKDEHFIGIMKIVPKSKNIPIGSFVNARIAGISQNQVNMHYLESDSEVGGYDSFKYTPFTYWLSHINQSKQAYGLSRFEEQKSICLIWMDGISIPPPGSPHYDKFLALQPIITETATSGQIDESIAPFLTMDRRENTEAGMEGLAPDRMTKNLLRATRQHRYDTQVPRHVPIDMQNFGCFTIGFDEDPDEAIAPPAFYLYNRDIRRSLIEEQLNLRNLWKFKRTLEIAKLHTEGEIKAFFYDARGHSFYDLLKSLSDPMERRKLKPKDAWFFERSVKVLLSGIQDFYLESIYDETDKEKLIYASIVPRSKEPGDFLEMDELSQYKGYIQHDFVMNKEVREALQRTLRILTQPNNSLMAHMRNRHRNIPDDVFYFYRKTLHYDTWIDYKMPEAELMDEITEGGYTGDTDVAGMTPLPPVSELVQNPESLSGHLLNQGLSQVKGLYSILLKLQRTPTSQIMDKTLAHVNQDQDERPDQDIEPEDLDVEADDEYMTDGMSKVPQVVPARPRQNLRITSKEWRKLTEIPRGFNREELKQFIRDIKNYNPVHGVKLPIL